VGDGDLGEGGGGGVDSLGLLGAEESSSSSLFPGAHSSSELILFPSSSSANILLRMDSSPPLKTVVAEDQSHSVEETLRELTSPAPSPRNGVAFWSGVRSAGSECSLGIPQHWGTVPIYRIAP
jgi:hypothetical protein